MSGKRKSLSVTVYYTDDTIELELWENGKKLGEDRSQKTLPEIFRTTEALAKLTGTCQGLLKAHAAMVAEGSNRNLKKTQQLFLSEAERVSDELMGSVDYQRIDNK